MVIEILSKKGNRAFFKWQFIETYPFQESFECPVCRKTVQQRSHLKTHINDIHGGKKALKAVLDKAKEFIKANPGFYQKALACAEQVSYI